MKRLLFTFLLICLFCTCKKDPYANLCGGSDPIKNLSWLKVKIETLQKSNNIDPIIYRFTYQSNTFFCEGSTCTNCSWVPQFYDCDGNKLNPTQEQSDQFISEVFLHKEVIWKAD
ncbi:MAG: hypothetical protein EOP41_02220 [Sphingobacteriaceae bacterium]|nr:MAG: hypothetical protein EOP41_02220 [Sphingobacteriaceae bacterium]